MLAAVPSQQGLLASHEAMLIFGVMFMTTVGVVVQTRAARLPQIEIEFQLYSGCRVRIELDRKSEIKARIEAGFFVAILIDTKKIQGEYRLPLVQWNCQKDVQRQYFFSC